MLGSTSISYRLSHITVLDVFNAMEACLKLDNSDTIRFGLRYKCETVQFENKLMFIASAKWLLKPNEILVYCQ